MSKKSPKKRNVRGFLREVSGNVAVTFGIAVVPLVGFAGAAYDYANASAFKAKLQAVADEIALSALTLNSDSRIATANATLNDLPGAVDPVEVRFEEDTVFVTATGSIETKILAAIGINRIPVNVRAVAAPGEEGPPVCLLALNKNAQNAISFSGSSSFFGQDCAVHSNSRHASGLTVTGSARPVAAGFCSVGGASVPADLNPKPQTKCRPKKDPFAGKIDPPPSQGCTYNNVSVGPQANVTLQPGVYCGGLTIRGTANLVEGGVYVIKDGELRVNSQGSLIGHEVFFYLTGSGSGFTINGGGVVSLHATPDGDHGGVLIYQDPMSNPGGENRLNGSSDTVINGAIYTPANEVRLNGSSGFGQRSAYMPVVADKITVTGSTDMAVDLDGIEMIAPLPAATEMARLIE